MTAMKRRRTMRVFSIREDVFKTEPLFIVDCSYDDLRAYLDRRFGVTIASAEGGELGVMFTFARAPWRVVWVKRATLPVVVHEIVHLVTRLCADRGIPIVAHHPNGTNGDETAAFLIEYFTRAYLARRRRLARTA